MIYEKIWLYEIWNVHCKSFIVCPPNTSSVIYFPSSFVWWFFIVFIGTNKKKEILSHLDSHDWQQNYCWGNNDWASLTVKRFMSKPLLRMDWFRCLNTTDTSQQVNQNYSIFVFHRVHFWIIFFCSYDDLSHVHH